jgi:hypothetical protein
LWPKICKKPTFLFNIEINIRPLFVKSPLFLAKSPLLKIKMGVDFLYKNRKNKLKMTKNGLKMG